MRRIIEGAVLAAALLATSLITASTPVQAADSTVVVRPGTADWGFADDNGNGGSGSFVAGPGTPPAGGGSVQLSVAGTQGYLFGWSGVPTVRLDELTALGYSTYRQSADPGDNLAIALQLQVDPDVTDAVFGWFGRLVFEPYQGGATVPQDTWQDWSPLTSGEWWGSGAPFNTVCPQANPCTWSQVLAAFPNAGINPVAPAVVFKAGSGWTSFTGNVDRFVWGTSAGTTTFDFDPFDTIGPCPVTKAGATWTLLGDCTTSSTLSVPDGITLDGAGHTITAVDPAGGAFTGAVVQNATGATTMHVRDVRIDGHGTLAVSCKSGDARLAGIRFRDAGGSVTGVTVSGVAQSAGGVLSGCQEGVAVEARNDSSTLRHVTVDGSRVDGYQKGGIVVTGKVAARITDNWVIGAGPLAVPSPAQNGVQVSFGATALVRGNVIAGNDYTPKSWVACGVLLYQAHGVRLQHNHFAGNERNLCNVGRGGGREHDDD